MFSKWINEAVGEAEQMRRALALLAPAPSVSVGDVVERLRAFSVKTAVLDRLPIAEKATTYRDIDLRMVYEPDAEDGAAVTAEITPCTQDRVGGGT